MTEVRTIFSWNVNGYTPKIHETVKRIIAESTPTILFFTETKRSEQELRRLFLELKDNYTFIINSHIPEYIHGVAMLIHKSITNLNRLTVHLNIPCRKDSKGCDASVGRLIAVELPLPGKSIVVVGTYTPNSGMNGEETNIKFSYRVDTWDTAFYQLIKELRQHVEVIWIGDANVAPDLTVDISLARMKTWAGCRPKERSNLSGLFQDGWIDVWRKEHPTNREYTWRGKQDSRKYGMRIDHVIITPDLWSKVDSSFICHDCPGSDHVPVGLHITF